MSIQAQFVFTAAVSICAAFTASRAGATQAPLARQVVAPASDITSGVVRLPAPGDHATVSSAALFDLRFRREHPTLWSATFSVPVERSGAWTLVLLSPSAARMRVFAAPEGAPLRAIDESHAVERRVGFVGEGWPGWVADRRDVRGAAAGRWNVRVETDSSGAADGGFLFASAGGDLSARAHLTTLRTVVGEPIFVAARMTGRDFANVASARISFANEHLERELAMFDDGAHDDGLARDGVFGAALPDDIAGTVRARVDFIGTTRTGQTFARSAPLAFEVVTPKVQLTGAVVARDLDARRLEFAIEGAPLGDAPRLHVSAEVWGRALDGSAVPVCWLSRQLEPRANGTNLEMPLEFERVWLVATGAGTPLELRNVRVQDPDTEVVLAEATTLALPLGFTRTPSVPQASQTPTPTFGTAAMSASGGATNVGPYTEIQASAIAPALMLVHGYCSSGSIWPAADFTAPKLEFLDPNANRSHDQFAQLLAQRATTAGLSSFGIVAHSQGGPAALHLLTYYTSGLDFASGGRRIQSLASPYSGTPLASLGSFACGVNNNMTPSGAATWLAGIPTWARAEVFTWTTANSGSACNFLTGLLLTDPEDGTVEKFRSELAGGNNMGHTPGWCHTTGMTNPASYTDHTRNQAMNAAAAR